MLECRHHSQLHAVEVGVPPFHNKLPTHASGVPEQLHSVPVPRNVNSLLLHRSTLRCNVYVILLKSSLITVWPLCEVVIAGVLSTSVAA